MKTSIYKLGLDVGSTTAKAVLINSDLSIAFSDYQRHYGSIIETLTDIVKKAKNIFGNIELSVAITGSAGMGISEKTKIPFLQELIASSEFVDKFHPDIKTLIDIGGEDSKIIFFDDKSGHDLRMNGSCAGGTGSFIDQMANLLDVSLSKLDKLASQFNEIHSIASRCGVFAKTDVQNLLSREIPLPDICASIFDAVALQIKNSLLRGKEIKSKVVYAGGPLTFLSNLRASMNRIFEIEDKDILHLEHPELLPAIGSAVADNIEKPVFGIDTLIDNLIQSKKVSIVSDSNIKPLFEDNQDYLEWKEFKSNIKAPRIDISQLDNKKCFLGIDSGSTTTKIVLIDEDNKIAFDFYQNNNGKPIESVKKGLLELRDICFDRDINPNIISSTVTGYGEDLIKSAFNINYGVVETIAHYKAAKIFDSNVSFILDIGGQDMKAIFVKDGIIQNIEINEACSSGCGSFIETFANSLDYSVEKFSEIAVTAYQPCDLGTRCTVFMNSKVKQSFREGSPVSDISAGLAYSVVQNCLHKVLKIYDNAVLGDNIVVQGGTFKNDAVHRAFEKISGKKVISPDISELMGAYGSAIIAKDFYVQDENAVKQSFNLNLIENIGEYDVKFTVCQGCENHCKVSRLKFENGNIFFTGNRCERIFSNSGSKIKRGQNLVQYKYDLLFDRNLKPEKGIKQKIGIPRALNMFENFPFWATLFVETGFEIVLSDKTSESTAHRASGTLMSDNICFPAKITNGHILNLLNKEVDRIFYPIVNYEKQEFDEMSNSFNCPVVTGYPSVIKSAINPYEKYGIPYDTPNINFKKLKLLKKACFIYFSSLGVNKKEFNKAFKLAVAENSKFKELLKTKASEILIQSVIDNRKVIVLAQRPYQIDSVVNHGIPEMIADFGYDVITEDSLPYTKEDTVDNLVVLSQWGYPNRLYRAAKWALRFDNVEFIQLNSFGCGPDTLVIDEIADLMELSGKAHSVIRIDEQSAPGSLKLRIRSLIESFKLRVENNLGTSNNNIRKTTKIFTDTDKNRTIIAPFFSPFHSAYATAAFKSLGYNIEQLPPSDKESIDLGLKYINNEICYPATLVVGDVLKALKSGDYDIDNVAVGITQTGGQCRASNYLPLIKKGLIKNGYYNIPVVGITLSNMELNNQPGFKISKIKFMNQAILGLLYGDAISRMFYAMAPREKVKGSAEKVSNKYADLAQDLIAKSEKNKILEILKDAVEEFNQIEVTSDTVPRIGIVGEIYVKYNPIGNNHAIDYLIEHGVEPVIPPLINMFTQWFVNIDVKNNFLIDSKPIMKELGHFFEKKYNKIDSEFENIMSSFKYNHPKHNIRHIAELAEKAVNLSVHYFGEGWLIAGDILAFEDYGINNVLCLQPFGCIANHVVAKGIENTLKKINSKLNVLFLDIDSGVSPVNLHNRLYLLMKNAEKEIGEISKMNQIEQLREVKI